MCIRLLFCLQEKIKFQSEERNTERVLKSQHFLETCSSEIWTSPHKKCGTWPTSQDSWCTHKFELNMDLQEWRTVSKENHIHVLTTQHPLTKHLPSVIFHYILLHNGMHSFSSRFYLKLNTGGIWTCNLLICRQNITQHLQLNQRHSATLQIPSPTVCMT